ncbi:MAG: peptide chain release factor 2 [Candidatus Cloacimonetes bacterium]|nr:peptide chain release factor 2 [Candidatus Cloacimonadota bacterium]
MEFREFVKQVSELQKQASEIRRYLDPAGKRKQVKELEEEMSHPDFWDDQERAKEISEQVSNLKNDIETAEKVEEWTEELSTFIELLKLEKDKELEKEAEGKLIKAERLFNKLELRLLLDDEDDESDVILVIHPGAGGTESQDWAEMLLRMYLKWAKAQEFSTVMLDKQAGDTAGIKSATVEIKGKFTYGYLKGENGVHRLVRISPFDANKRRHTSFASVFVYPEKEEDVEVEINENDLKIDTYRASGAGGQHVNTSDTAVRVTHLPTNTVVQCQSERSQHSNKSNAIKVLKSRLYQIEKEEREKEKQKQESKKKKIEWGSQIRSYVMHPYSMVKDHRTDYKTGNVEAVMDGDIDSFIDAYLKMK